MRFILAGIAFIASLACFGLGAWQIMQAQAADHVTVAGASTSGAPFIVVPSETLVDHTGSQTFSIAGEGPMVAVVGRQGDVAGWVGDTTHDRAVVDDASGAIIFEAAPGAEATAPNPLGSDLWYEEYTGENGLEFSTSLPPGFAVLIASTGEQPAPGQVSLTWPLDGRAPWSGPLLVAGIVLLLAALGLLLWALMSLRRGGRARRSGRADGPIALAPSTSPLHTGATPTQSVEADADGLDDDAALADDAMTDTDASESASAVVGEEGLAPLVGDEAVAVERDDAVFAAPSEPLVRDDESTADSTDWAPPAGPWAAPSEPGLWHEEGDAAGAADDGDSADASATAKEPKPITGSITAPLAAHGSAALAATEADAPNAEAQPGAGVGLGEAEAEEPIALETPESSAVEPDAQEPAAPATGEFGFGFVRQASPEAEAGVTPDFGSGTPGDGQDDTPVATDADDAGPEGAAAPTSGAAATPDAANDASEPVQAASTDINTDTDDDKGDDTGDDDTGGGSRPPKPPTTPPSSPGADDASQWKRPRGRDRTAAPKRMFRLAPALLIGSLVLTGCSADMWPESLGGSQENPTATPTSTIDQALLNEGAPLPAVNEAQLDRILADAAAVATAADVSGDVAALGARFSDAALQAREAAYKARAVDAALPAPTPFPAGGVVYAIPQATDAWPRTVFAVVEMGAAAEGGAAPAGIMLVQASARDPYKVASITELVGNAQLPEAAPVAIGAPGLEQLDGTLVAPVANIAADYGEIMLKGDAAANAAVFATSSDPFIAQVGQEYRDAQLAAIDQAASRLEFTNQPSQYQPLGVGTLDGGAIVAVSVQEIEKFSARLQLATLSIQGRAAALAGASTSQYGFERTYTDQLLFAVPPASSGGQIQLIGYSQTMTGARQLQQSEVTYG